VQLNLHRLWIFMQVVECGGFSAAAQQLYMSQPSVSNQVRQLERSLHATLIDRSGARIRPTAEGEILMEYAKRVFLLADEAVSAVQQVSGLKTGRLVVGGTTTVGTYLLPELLAAFRRSYPGIECDIFVGNGVQVLKRLLDGELGLAVFAGAPAAPQLVTVPIRSDRLVLVTAPDHQLAGKTVAAADLAGERFLLRERGSSTRDEAEEALASWDLGEVETSEIWGPETLKQSVAAGLGIALISEHAVRNELADGRLGVVEVEPAQPGRPIVIAQRRDRLLSPAERAFADRLTNRHL
jgi:LysR family transcriptional regulator, low CO2-responsive transcriptional regulator